MSLESILIFFTFYLAWYNYVEVGLEEWPEFHKYWLQVKIPVCVIAFWLTWDRR